MDGISAARSPQRSPAKTVDSMFHIQEWNIDCSNLDQLTDLGVLYLLQIQGWNIGCSNQTVMERYPCRFRLQIQEGKLEGPNRAASQPRSGHESFKSRNAIWKVRSAYITHARGGIEASNSRHG